MELGNGVTSYQPTTKFSLKIFEVGGAVVDICSTMVTEKGVSGSDPVELRGSIFPSFYERLWTAWFRQRDTFRVAEHSESN